MINSNSRIEYDNGILFYEDDIIIDDILLSGDVKLTTTVSYASPGFGYIFINKDSYDDISYLFKIGLNSYEVFKIVNKNSISLKRGTLFLNPDGAEITMSLVKKNEDFVMYINDTAIVEVNIDDIPNYNVGYYSSAGNKILKSEIQSQTPYGWFFNMNNTEGGYINFINDGFSVSDCIGIAEIEQPKIFLNAGTYFLKYEFVGDHNVFVFDSASEILEDHKKNILKNNTFKVEEDSYVNIKFTGKNFDITNILLTTNSTDKYIPSSLDKNNSKPGYLKINMQNIKSVDIDFSINSSAVTSYIVKNDNQMISLTDAKIAEFVKYNICIDKSGQVNISSINTSYNNKIIISNFLTLFYNCNTIITKFIMIDIDGKEINILEEDFNEKYITLLGTEPIIVTNADLEPLNLVSEYRYYYKKDKKYYEFTNIKREILDSKELLKVGSKILENSLVNIYGIRHKRNVNYSNLFMGDETDINNISYACSTTEIIPMEDVISINYKKGKIKLSPITVSKYECFIIDYKMSESYVVNKIKDNSYKVVVSSNDNSYILSEKITANNDYKILNIIPENSKFIVLRKDDVYENPLRTAQDSDKQPNR